jgi:hypothetical protein
MISSSSSGQQPEQMLADPPLDLCHEVRRKPSRTVASLVELATGVGSAAPWSCLTAGMVSETVVVDPRGSVSRLHQERGRAPSATPPVPRLESAPGGHHECRPMRSASFSPTTAGRPAACWLFSTAWTRLYGRGRTLSASADARACCESWDAAPSGGGGTAHRRRPITRRPEPDRLRRRTGREGQHARLKPTGRP